MTQSVPINNFKEFCEEAVGNFLQTVVAIDDDPGGESRTNPVQKKKKAEAGQEKPKGIKPLKGLSTAAIQAGVDPKPKKAISEETTNIDDERVGISLKANRLIEDLAEKRILCSIFAPQGEEDDEIERHIDKASKMASCADAIILDWDLRGAGGALTAEEIFGKIISNDFERGGRLRLILIYTKEMGLSGIQDRLVRKIKDTYSEDLIEIFQEGQQDCKFPSILFPNSRVVLVNKKDKLNAKPDLQKSEEELHKVLVEEFANLAFGLLPGIALHAIAAIRKETHSLLKTLNKKHDSALICHGLMVKKSEDTAEFCLDLIHGEMRSVFSLQKIGEKHANSEIFKLRLADLANDGKFKYEWEGATLEFSLESILKEIDEGKDNLTDTKEQAARIYGEHNNNDNPKSWETFSLKMKKPDSQLHALILSGDQAKADHSNHGLSRLSGLKREAFSEERHLPEEWSPHLTLGTVVQGANSQDLLVCVQPRCDSIRLKEKRNFPFLILQKSSPGERGLAVAILLKSSDGQNIEEVWYIDASPHKQTILEFHPDDNGVISSDENKTFETAGDSGKKFTWIADIKDFRMQKIADMLSGRQGEIALDDYEWLRLKGAGK